jgi:Flp pilus assembly protein TadD
MPRRSLPASLPDNRVEGSRRHGRRAAAAFAIVAFALVGCVGAGEEPPQTGAAEAPAAPAVPPGALDVAELAIADGRLNDAGQILRRVLLADPANARARLAQAELYLASGGSGQAMGVFESLVDDPEFGPAANQGLGIAMLLAGIEDPGVAHLRRAVEADPALWRAWNALGSHYDSKGQWETASEAYAKALTQRPDEATIYNNRGFSLFMQGRLDEATADLSRAVRLDPELELARINLRLALAWNGKYVQAMSGTSREDMGMVLNNIGYIAMMRGDLENAEAYLVRAMEADPSFNEVAWRNLAHLRDVKEMKSAEAADE